MTTVATAKDTPAQSTKKTRITKPHDDKGNLLTPRQRANKTFKKLAEPLFDATKTSCVKCYEDHIKLKIKRLDFSDKKERLTHNEKLVPGSAKHSFVLGASDQAKEDLKEDFDNLGCWRNAISTRQARERVGERKRVRARPGV